MCCSSILKAFLVSLSLLHVCIGKCWGWAWDLINSYTEFGVPYFSSIFFKKPFLPTLQVTRAPIYSFLYPERQNLPGLPNLRRTRGVHMASLPATTAVQLLIWDLHCDKAKGEKKRKDKQLKDSSHFFFLDLQNLLSLALCLKRGGFSQTSCFHSLKVQF